MIEDNIKNILSELPADVRLLAVSKFHPAEALMEAYTAGQRLFGESRPQEFQAKAKALPRDIEWHFIGHLQHNKLKMVLLYASLVESIDSRRLLEAVNAWGEKNGKVINCLLELHLGSELSKGGFAAEEIEEVLSEAASFPFVSFKGLMGMATNTDDEAVIRSDFSRIADLKARLTAAHPELADFTELSIGMSNDWRIAIEYGSTIVRIGTAIFGPREY